MNLLALRNRNAVKVLMFISRIFDSYKLFFLPYLTYITGVNARERLVIFLNYFVFEFFVMTLKNLFKTPRPCFGEDGCPKYYDIPSGHSFGGIYFYLLLLNRNYTEDEIKKNPLLPISKQIFLIILGLQPIFRYLCNVHSITAIVTGSMIGYMAFKSKYILEYTLKNLE